jgi:hypothetical protein
MMTTRIICLLTVIGAFASWNAAEAATYSWAYNGSGSASGSGTLETGPAEPNNGVLITGITGTWSTYTISGLVPAATFQSNDNILYPNSTPLLDSGGFAFLDSQGASFYVNISYGTLAGHTGYLAAQVASVETITQCDNQGNCTTTTSPHTVNTFIGTSDAFSVAPINSSTTPVPGTFALFATGIGGLGLLGWRRKRLNK